MKSVLFLLCMCAFEAFAAPQVGDYAKYDQTQLKPDATVVNREVTMTVVGVSEDGETISVEVASTSASGDGIPARVVDMPLGRGDIEGYVTVEIAEELMATCEEDGGVYETIVVPAGEFDSCRVESNSEQSKNTTWRAVVPSGFVKQKVFWVPSANLNTFELKSFGGSSATQ